MGSPHEGQSTNTSTTISMRERSQVVPGRVQQVLGALAVLVLAVSPVGAEPAPAPALPPPVLWREPPSPASLDLAAGPGGAEGAPAPPFTFLVEDQSGTSPKL